MAFFEASRSSMADSLLGCTLDEALTLACPEAAGVLRMEDDGDRLSALRSSGFRIVERAEPGSLYFVRAGVARWRDDRWVAIVGGKQGVKLHDGTCEKKMAARDALRLISGPVVEVERPLEFESIAATILRSAREERGTIVSAVSATVLGPVLALVPAAALMYTFNDVIPNALDGAVPLVAVTLVVTAMFQAWVSTVRLETMLYVRARLEVGIARRLLAKTLRLPFAFLHKSSVSGLIEVFRGLSRARELVTDRLLGAGFDGLMSIAILIAIAFFSPGVAMALGGCAIGYLALAGLTGYRHMRMERTELRARTATRERLMDAIRAIATVKAAAAEDSMVARWRSRLVIELIAGVRRQRLGLYSTAGRDGMRQLTMFGVLIAGALLIKDGGARFGSYVAVLQLTGTYLGGILGLGTLLHSVFMSAPHVQQAREISRVAPVPRVRRGSRPGKIVIDDLWFRYTEDGPWVLRGYSAVLEPEQVYRVDGPSGSGKTTILRLLSTIYTPTRGRIHVKGVDIHRAGVPFLYLPQNVQLFEGSLLDNLRLLSGGVATERILAAAQEIGLATWAASLPMGYATLLMSGAAVSGGQKQLVALTAAAAADVPMLLLDEAGSNLDAATYRHVFASRVWQGRTIVYVGHAMYAHLPGTQTLSVTGAPSS